MTSFEFFYWQGLSGRQGAAGPDGASGKNVSKLIKEKNSEYRIIEEKPL